MLQMLLDLLLEGGYFAVELFELLLVVKGKGLQLRFVELFCVVKLLLQLKDALRLLLGELWGAALALFWALKEGGFLKLEVGFRVG